MKFRIAPAGTTSKAAKLYQIPSDPLKSIGKILYESTRGLLQARNIRVIPDEVERMEDGSIAPWSKVRVEVFWGKHLGWQEEVVKSSRVIPEEARGPNNTINPFRWTDEEDP